MIRKMLRTIGSPPASILLNLSMIAPSSPVVLCVDAPRTCARGRQIEAGETIQNRQRAAIDQRMKSLREVRDEIGERHFTGENEGDGLRPQADDQQRAADQFDEPGRADQRERLDVGVSRKYRKADDLGHAVLDDQQSGDDAQYAQY